MVKKYPNDSFAYYRLGSYYGFTENYNEAISNFKKALSISPENISALKALSIAYIQNRENGKATEMADKILRLRRVGSYIRKVKRMNP